MADTVPSILRAIYGPVFHVPLCNGWLGYLVPSLVAALVLPRKPLILALTPLVAALLDVASRGMANDTHWMLLMPLWKLVPSAVATLLLLAILNKK